MKFHPILTNVGDHVAFKEYKVWEVQNAMKQTPSTLAVSVFVLSVSFSHSLDWTYTCVPSDRSFFFHSLSFLVYWRNRFTTCASVSFSSLTSLKGLYFFLKKKKEKTDMFLQIDLPAVEQAPDTHIQTHLHLRKQATCVWESFFPPVIGCNWRYLLFIVSLKTTGNQKQKTASDVYFCVCVYEIIETCQFQQFTFLFFFKYQKSQTALHENCSWLVVHGLFLFWKVSMFWLRA